MARRFAIIPALPFLLLALGLAVGTQPPAQRVYRPDRPIAIVGGLLVDATGTPARPDHTVVIEGERITAVGARGQVRIPEGAEVIDATGMTVMPGLIDTNQHMQLNPLYPAPTANLPIGALRARWERNFARQPQWAFVYLMQGVTSFRQTSGPARQTLPVKRAIDRGELPGPRIFLGGGLFMSEAHFDAYIRERGTPPAAVDWLRNEFAYVVIRNVDTDTEPYVGEEFHYWKLYMSDEPWDGRNDFTDKQLRFIIDKAHRYGKKVDVHAGGHNHGLRRMLDFAVDTLEHPFYGHELIADDVIEGYVRKNVIVASLLKVMIAGTERAADPHRFSETLYAMSLDPQEHRVLMGYRDTMLAKLRRPSEPGLSVYDPARPPDFPELRLPGAETPARAFSIEEQQRRLRTSKENMRRFIAAGAKLAMGTDTGSFLNFQQEDPNIAEMMYMGEMGMTPMQAIQASTRNGAEALGLLDELGTIEPGKLADVIVVAGNPLEDMAVMKRVYAVVKGGVRYK